MGYLRINFVDPEKETLVLPENNYIISMDSSNDYMMTGSTSSIWRRISVTLNHAMPTEVPEGEEFASLNLVIAPIVEQIGKSVISRVDWIDGNCLVGLMSGEIRYSYSLSKIEHLNLYQEYLSFTHPSEVPEGVVMGEVHSPHLLSEESPEEE